MAHDEVEAGSGRARPQRLSHWRTVIVGSVAVLATAAVVPAVLHASDEPVHRGPMVHEGQMMPSGQMMPGMMAGSGHMLLDPEQMAEMMQQGRHMTDMGSMMGGAR